MDSPANDSRVSGVSENSSENKEAAKAESGRAYNDPREVKRRKQEFEKQNKTAPAPLQNTQDKSFADNTANQER